MGKVLWPIVGMGVLVAVLAVLAKARPRRAKQGSAPDGPWPYRVRRLLSDPERVLLDRVRAALPDHLVFAQVQVARVLEVTGRSDSTTWFNRIAQLSFDILVCTQDTMPVLAIELDDSSHGRAKQQERDAKKDRACHDAGLQIVRWSVRGLPTPDAIRSALPTAASAESGRQPALRS